MIEPVLFTHAEWQVHAGREEEFIAAWRAIATAFNILPSPPYWGTLLQSEQDASRFCSFGPWPSAAAIASMRANPDARDAIERAMALCIRATPGTYRQVAHVDVRNPAT